MNEFLFELAEKVYRENDQPENVTIVFPNRRAILYFRKHFTALLKKPTFSPQLLTIEEFIKKFSDKQIPDKLVLLKMLYHVYTDIFNERGVQGESQSFSGFYFWGEMLLRDFEEIDKYLVDASQLFIDLTNQKELETIFEFLSEEQTEFLREFWGNFNEHPSQKKEQFLRVWRMLNRVYAAFREALANKGYAYNGMVHRLVAESVDRCEWKPETKLIFAGFNALTFAEERILTHFVEQHHAQVVWDTDAYYVNNNTQEAGTFFREYQRHTVLGKTFPLHTAANIHKKISDQRVIKVVGAAQPVGQVKAMAQLLEEQLANGWKPEETLIVLPDEKLLLPVLHSIPASVKKLNVTMGFPLASSPLYNLLELLFELQTTVTTDGFHHRPALALLNHAYVISITGDTYDLRKEITQANWVHVPNDFFSERADVFQLLFREVAPEAMLAYVRSVVEQIGKSVTGDLDREYAFQFYTFINRLQEVAEAELLAEQTGRRRTLQSMLRVLQQLARSERIPFAGEPLEGLQIMGVLETRNLDFKNVIVLSLNEGSLPAGSAKGSYIPYNLRKAYGLPTAAHQDAMYAYLFYRSWQRAENVVLFYNTETDVLGQGEMSRYLQQLIYESGLNVQRHVVHNAVLPRTPDPIRIVKSEDVIKKLVERSGKGLYPSALNSYLECRLKFYLKYVVNVREPNEIEEDLDNRVVGDFLHKVIERYYKRLQNRKRSATIESSDLQDVDSELAIILDEVFRENYGLSEKRPVVYKGQRLVVREIVKRFAERIIELDKAYAPFTLEALERDNLARTVTIEHEPKTVTVNGIVDRADRKGNVLRVVDYKTGRDELSFTSIASLFDREGKKNKAAFQTLVYALLFADEVKGDVKLVPGLINRKNLFDPDFDFGLRMNKERVENVLPLLPEFEEHLRTMLSELFNPAVEFDQTKDEEICRYCEFNSICYRG